MTAVRLAEVDRGVTVGPTCAAPRRDKCGGANQRRYDAFLAEMGARHRRERVEFAAELRRDTVQGWAIVAASVAVHVLAFVLALLFAHPVSP